MVALMYALLRIRNDANSVVKGKVGRRIGRRVTGRMTGKFMNGLFK